MVAGWGVFCSLFLVYSFAGVGAGMELQRAVSGGMMLSGMRASIHTQQSGEMSV